MRRGIQHADEKTIPFFNALVDREVLDTTKRGWVILLDAIVEVELVGGWTISDRGPRLPQALCMEEVLVLKRPDLAPKELFVLGKCGGLCLYRQHDPTRSFIRVLDRLIAVRREPSGHQDGRPDIRFRRG